MNFGLPFVRGIEKKEPTIQITPMGEEKAEKFEGGGLEFRALAFIHDQGPASMKELSSGLGVEPDKARAVANALIKKGWAQRV